MNTAGSLQVARITPPGILFAVWSPCLRKDVNKSERAQQVFTRFVWYRMTPASGRQNKAYYLHRLFNFRLKMLEEKRASLDLFSSFRILRSELHILPSKY